MNYYSAEVLADSISEWGVRLTTVLATAPRFILAEINTHRVLSRSSASSRAIPVKKRIDAVLSEPFVPASFGKNRPGMQATENLDNAEALKAEQAWLRVRDACVKGAQELAELEVHKQYANRPLELFSWNTAVITTTEWSNLLALRIHPDAQPEFQRMATHLRDALASSQPKLKRVHEWHLPYIEGSPDETQVREEVAAETLRRALKQGSHHAFRFEAEMLAQISSARCARVSYLLHDGTRNIQKDMERGVDLRNSGHMGALEHAARPLHPNEIADTLLNYSGVTGVDVGDINPAEHFCGNLRGWKQYRKTLRYEDDFAKFLKWKNEGREL